MRVRIGFVNPLHLRKDGLDMSIQAEQVRQLVTWVSITKWTSSREGQVGCIIDLEAY